MGARRRRQLDGEGQEERHVACLAPDVVEVQLHDPVHRPRRCAVRGIPECRRQAVATARTGPSPTMQPSRPPATQAAGLQSLATTYGAVVPSTVPETASEAEQNYPTRAALPAVPLLGPDGIEQCTKPLRLLSREPIERGRGQPLEESTPPCEVGIRAIKQGTLPEALEAVRSV